MFRKPRSAISGLCFIFIFLNSRQLITIATTSVTTSPFSNETDRQALLAIKDLIPGDPHGVLSSWNESIHFCKWQGVTCGRHHRQRVSILDLSSSGLVGPVSPHIGNLTFLWIIDLGSNGFRGTIPQETGRLFRLQKLILANNSFEGELPASLTHCPNLKVIDLNDNCLGGEIPVWLSSLSSLTILQLTANNFRGPIPPSLGNLSALFSLSLAINSLGGTIPFELGQLSNLEFIQLSGNNLTGMIPTQLLNISSLYFFSMAVNRLHGSLPRELGFTVPKLQTFYIGGNLFHGPIPSSIANASGLRDIDTTLNFITGPIPMNMGSLHGLEFFSVSGNSLGTKNANELKDIFNSLSNCSNLQTLLLANNHFGGQLPHSVANLSTSVGILSLNTNSISGSIPLGIGNLVNLNKLTLHNNMLTGSIPVSIGKLSKLQQLYMDANNISGEIPSSIGNLTQLGNLDLARNTLEGSIPVSLGNCKSLLAVDLAYNHLSGLIPQQIFGLSSLSIGLFLSHNNLAGPIPMDFGNLENLEKLDLSENKFSGEIPATLGSFQVLETLSMAGNHFEGSIPASFEQLKGIQVLDLSRNNLSGQIPLFFGELTSLQNLNLSYNMLEGEVPNEAMFQNLSAFSIAGNDKLCGGVKELQLPPCPAKVSERGKRPLYYRVMIPLVTISLVVALLLICLATVFFRIRRLTYQTSSVSPLQNEHPKLSYAEILQATSGFSSANLIGEGRYGSVYKGVLNSSDQIIAVKMLNLHQRGANKSFMAECEALKNIRHRNIVKTITSCSSIDFKGNDFKALVFGFMPNGSLESWLHPSIPEQEDLRSLNFFQRLNIAIDVASALDYLHHQCEMTLIHCDLKPSNILLDDVFCAQVGDFGLARILSTTTNKSRRQQSTSVGIRGTIGYIAPEYGMSEEVSTQGDMYSYGVLLLEMFRGKRPTDNMFTDNISLRSYAKMSLPDQVMTIVDPRIIPEEEEDPSTIKQSKRTDISKLEICVVSILQLGISCSAELPIERLNAKDVVMKLCKITDVYLGVKGPGLQDGRIMES